MKKSQGRNSLRRQNPDKAPKKKNWKGLGCGMLLLFVLGFPVCVFLAIFWDFPGSAPLAELLWNDAKLPWMLGLVLSSAGLYLYALEKGGGEDCHTPVTAVIAEIAVEDQYSDYSRGRYNTYTPIYAYTLDEEEIRVRSRYASTNKDKYRVGQEIELLVAPGQPDQYCIKNKSARTLLIGKIVAGIGISLSVIGLVMWLLSLLLLLAG